MDHGKDDTWKMNSRVRGRFLSLEGSQKKKILWVREKERKEKKRKKRKKRKNKKEGECVRVRGKKIVRGEGKKEKETTLPFAISSKPTVKTRWGKRKSWSMQ